MHRALLSYAEAATIADRSAFAALGVALILPERTSFTFSVRTHDEGPQEKEAATTIFFGPQG